MEADGSLVPDRALQAALALHRAGRLDAAEAAYRRLLDGARGDDAAHFLGLLLMDRGDPMRAEPLLHRARAATERADAACDHGRVLVALRRYRAAETALEAALTRQPNYVPAWVELATARLEQGALAPALAACEQALALLPSDRAARLNRGVVRTLMGHLDAALEDFDHLLARDPHDAGAHFNRALVLLSRQRYAEGFAEYYWRHALPEAATHLARLPLARWRGGTLAGTHLVVAAEQGYGDSLQFLRFLPALKARGARIDLLVPPALVALLRGQVAADRILSALDTDAAHAAGVVALMDLPLILGLGPTDVPSGGYLQADPARVAVWRQRLAGPGKAVGVAWQGNPGRRLDRMRSAPLAAFAPLRALPGIRWFSLQLDAAPGGDAWPELTELSGEIADFADSAAAVSALDAVVSVDTALAHLTGALGRPGLVLLEKVPDWRYGLSGQRCPWYDSLRLCRQTVAGEWQSAAHGAAQMLPVVLAGGHKKSSL